MSDDVEIKLGRFTVTFSEGDGVADGLWISNEEGEGIRVEEQDLADYFEDHF